MTGLQHSSAKSGKKILTPTTQTVLQAITQILSKSNNLHVNYLCCMVVHLIQMGSGYLNHSQLGHFLVLTVQGNTGRQVETSIGYCNLQQSWIFFFSFYFIFQGPVTQNIQLFCMADFLFGPGGSIFLHFGTPQKASFRPLFQMTTFDFLCINTDLTQGLAGYCSYTFKSNEHISVNIFTIGCQYIVIWGGQSTKPGKMKKSNIFPIIFDQPSYIPLSRYIIPGSLRQSFGYWGII